MNAFQAMIIIALFGILGALLAPGANAIPPKICRHYSGEVITVPAYSFCPAGYTEVG